MQWRVRIGIVCAILLGSVSSFGQMYPRAPEVLPWTLPEMSDPDYWIGRIDNPDELIMTRDEIEAMNERYIRRISAPDPFTGLPEACIPSLSYWWPGLVTYVPDLESLGPVDVADTVRIRIQAELDYLRSMEFGNALGIAYSEGELDAIERNMALDLVKDTVAVMKGIAARNTRLRNNTSFFPEQVGLMQTGKSRWDGWNIGIVRIGRPVTILHRSRDGEYLFVLGDMGYGWVRSEDIAVGSTDDIRRFTESESFVICTDNRVRFYTDESCQYASGWFGMSTRLPLVSGDNPRHIQVPVRRTDGTFDIETAWLADDAQVHVGYVPYTRRNILETAFRLLGDTYDWSGAWYGRQHETTYRDIFACFGFDLPQYAALFSYYGGDTEVMSPDIGKVKQYEQILEHEPVVTIQTCGSHAQILLGDHNGMPIVFDQHGYGYIDSNSIDREIRRCHIGDVQMPPYFLTKNVTFLKLAP